MAKTTDTESTAPAKARIPFPLEHPAADGKPLELDYRRPTGRDMRKAMAESGMGRYASLLTNLFEVDEATLDRLDGADYMRLIKLADGFFDPAPKT